MLMFVLSLNLPEVTFTSSARRFSRCNPSWKVPIPVAVIPAPVIFTPLLALIFATETFPENAPLVKVAAVPVTLPLNITAVAMPVEFTPLTLMSGVPVIPDALVAVVIVAVVAVSALPVTFPVKLPTKPPAVATPAIFTPPSPVMP